MSLVFAIGSAWWALAVGLQVNYLGDQFGGMILTGVGVGLTLPTMMATGTASLPAHSFATGSAVVGDAPLTGSSGVGPLARGDCAF